MVARLTPDQKAACSNHVGVSHSLILHTQFSLSFRCDRLRVGPGGGRADEGRQEEERHGTVLLDRLRRMECEGSRLQRYVAREGIILSHGIFFS